MSARRAAGAAAAALLGLALAGAAPRARAPQPAPPRPADPLAAEFEAALAPGLADSTAARLGRFVTRHPRSPWNGRAHLELGQLRYAKGDYAEAREEFRRARGAATLEDAQYWEGLAGFALGRPREARDAGGGLARGRAGAPRQWDAAYLVALTFAQEGRREEALAAYRGLLAEPGGEGEASALFEGRMLAHDLHAPADADAWGRRLLERYAASPEAATVRAEARAAAPMGAHPGP